MLATKDDAAHNHLSRQFKAHTIKRRYVALIHGLPQKIREAWTVPSGAIRPSGKR